jgi:hypothetical protein
MFSKAISVGSEIISISKLFYIKVASYNEWHEGTQIESSIKMKSKNDNFEYEDFSPNQDDFYMKKTLEWIRKFDKIEN